MNTVDTIGFSYRLILDTFDLAAWTWAAIAFLFSFFVLGLFWGMAWNRRWGVFGHIPSAFLSLIFGLLLGASVLAWLGADRTVVWIEARPEVLTRQITASGSFNREAFRNAWDKLQPLNGQGDRTPPAEGGNEIRLSGESDAKIVAFAAAETVRHHLQNQAPFAYGVPCIVRDPTAVADDAVAAVQRPNYPVDIPPNNEWTKQAVAIQVRAALESAAKQLYLPNQELKTALFFFCALLLVIQLVLIPIAAVRDIAENPKP